MKVATIVGAGLVGSLWAVYLSKAGYKVQIFEKRPDIRISDISAGKSINLALSERGWKAFKTVGVANEIKKIAIPMYGRTMHDLEGNLTYQPYGKEGQAIYSVSRGGINAKMMDIAEKLGSADISFNEVCTNVDMENGIVHFENNTSNATSEIQSDLIFAADGAFSAVRYKGMQQLNRFNYEQRYIEDGYREILLPANDDGSYKLEKNTLHIWPRGRFMLIALPNEDGSFTCTLFMPFENNENSFANLKTQEQVNAFFKSTFPDFFELMPNVADAWEDHPLSSLAIIRCYPWTHKKVALMGDAAHATVPFYGQGMNCGFEDCSIMWELMQQHGEDWTKIFEEYQQSRKPDGDAVQDLSLDNYHVMRDFVGDPDFLLQKKFELRISELYPKKYLPLYSQVSFSHIPYSEAYRKGKEQDVFIKGIMAENDIEKLFNSNQIDELIHKYYSD
jgi:kynurenine 3-monooxygenase